MIRLSIPSSSDLSVIDSVRYTILMLSTLTLFVTYMLVSCQIFFFPYYDQLFDMLVIAICGPIPVFWLINKNKLNKARILFISSILLSIIYIFLRRISSNLDSHVDINFIWLCLITHLLFDHLVAWLLSFFYLLLFFTARIVTILWLSKPFELDEFSSEFISICMVCWAVYAAKKAVIAIQREIELKQAQLADQKAELTEMNAVKDKLFNIIGHDLRSPIASLRLLANTESLLYENDFKKQQFAQQIDKVYLTVDNLLHWARLQKGKWKLMLAEVDISFLVYEVLELFKVEIATKQLKVKTDLSSIVITTDEYILGIVVRNIFHNAIKFTAVGQEIYITIEQWEDRTKITIRDTGVGMSEKMLLDIAQGEGASQVGTAGEKGTGLGLEICREFLALLGAKLHVESKLGLGTTAEILLSSTE